MSKAYLLDKLNTFSRETLVVVILYIQDQLGKMGANMEFLIEQIADANNKRQGHSFENQILIAGQLELDPFLMKQKL